MVRRYWRTNGIVDAWAMLASAALSWHLLVGTGYGLARDLVFTPSIPLNVDTLGLGSGSARAVPLDAVVGLATGVVDGTWLCRFAVFAGVALAGAGAARLVPTWPLVVRLLVAGFAVWNPFVIERLALGQWALLAAYGALPWLVRSATRFRVNADRAWWTLLPVVGWLALASVTPTGGVIGSVVAVVLGFSADRRRTAAMVLAVAGLQMPWIVPSLFNSSTATSDVAAVAAFAARSERFGGALPSLLGLGGVWDAGSVPASRSGLLGYVTTLVVVCGLIALPALGRSLPDGVGRRLAGVGFGGLVLAVASSTPGLDAWVRWLVDRVPGAGLLRDSQKWLMPFVLLAVLALGESLNQLVQRSRGIPSARYSAVILGALLPVLLLPDGMRTVQSTLTPVKYPDDFRVIAALVRGDDGVVTLPMSSYRLFDWGRPLAVADPASRWFDNRVITSDRLVVGDVVLRGEDPRAAEIADGIAAGRPIAEVLARAGVRWAVVYEDAPGVRDLSLAGLRPVHEGRQVSLYRVDGAITPPARASTPQIVIVLSIDLAVLVLVIGSVCVCTLRVCRRLGAQA